MSKKCQKFQIKDFSSESAFCPSRIGVLDFDKKMTLKSVGNAKENPLLNVKVTAPKFHNVRQTTILAKLK